LTGVVDLKAHAEAKGRDSIRCTTFSDIFAYGLVAFFYLAREINPFGDLSTERKIKLTIIPNVVKLTGQR